MRCGSRKKSTARFLPCWRRLQRSPSPSSTWREGQPSSAAGLLLYRKCGPSVGYLRDARSRCLHRAPVAGRDVAGCVPWKDRSANPVAEPRNFIAGGAIAGAAGAERSLRAACSPARRGAIFPAWNSGSRDVELSLLPRDSKDERGNGHHPAIHGAGLGVALYGGARSAASVVAEKRGGGAGRRRLCAGGRLRRFGGLPHACRRPPASPPASLFL